MSDRIDYILYCRDPAVLRRQFYETLEQIITLGKSSENTTDFVDEIAAIVEREYANPDLSVSFIADMMQQNPRTLSAKFIKKTGNGLLDYIHKVRIEKAKELLTVGGKSVQEVTYLTGYENPNTFAEVLLLLIPVAIAYMLCSKGWLGHFLGFFSAAVGCVAMAMTYSRASWVGLAFAAVVFVVLWNRKLIPFGILAALVVLAILPDTVFNRILTIFNTSDTSTNSRFPLYQAAGEFLQQRPVLGAGLGSDAVRQAIGDLNLFHGKDHFVHCHNIYLQVWCETGLVGVISFVGGILWTFKKGCRAVARATCDPVVRMTILGGAAALMGTMVCGLADYIWNYPRVMLIFWFVCALTLAGIRLAARQDGEETSAPVSE